MEKVPSSPRMKTLNQVNEQIKNWKIPDSQTENLLQYISLLHTTITSTNESQQQQQQEMMFKKQLKHLAESAYDPFSEKQESQARIMLVKTLQDQILEFERAETTIKIQRERLQSILKDTENSLLKTHKDIIKELINNLFISTNHNSVLKNVQQLGKLTEVDNNQLKVIPEIINAEKLMIQVQEQVDYFKCKLKQFWEIPFDYDDYLQDLYHQRQAIEEIKNCSDITKQIWVFIRKQINSYCGKITVI